MQELSAKSSWLDDFESIIAKGVSCQSLFKRLAAHLGLEPIIQFKSFSTGWLTSTIIVAFQIPHKAIEVHNQWLMNEWNGRQGTLSDYDWARTFFKAVLDAPDIRKRNLEKACLHFLEQYHISMKRLSSVPQDSEDYSINRDEGFAYHSLERKYLLKSFTFDSLEELELKLSLVGA